MAKAHENKVREQIRVEFAKHRRKECSVVESSKLAGISPSTYYAWNKGDAWSKASGWSKGDGWSK
ncbi:MAG: hypothetical protein Q7U07_02810 [Gammaproteobacteria bacterium]|nr:hypothetical protein [Gammaproteobacteria bacterium]